MNQLNQRIAALSPEQRAILERRLREKGIASRQASSIQKCDRSKPLPLSFSQQRMWLLEQLEPGGVTYNRPTHFQLSGVLDIEALKRSLQAIVQRHEVLRSRFPTIKGQPSLEIDQTLPVLLPLVDLSHLVEAEQHRELQHIIDKDAHTPFNLAAAPLFRLQLIKLSEKEHWLLFSLHHIIFDGWSAGVLQKEITALYSAFSTQQASPLPELAIQYVDFAQWQRQQLSETRIQSQLEYWRSKLSGELPVLNLPTDRPRSQSATDEGATYMHRLPSTLVNSLKSLSQQADATLFMTLLAAFKVLLYKYTQQTDITVGVPVAGRDRAATEPLIGIFINTIVLRTTLSENTTFQDYLAQVRKTSLEAYDNQSLPFEEVVKALKPNRKLKNPFFQLFFQLRNLSNEISSTDTLRIEPLKLERESVALDLSLDIVEKGEELVCHFQYPTALFDTSTIVQMAQDFQILLCDVLTNPLVRINAGISSLLHQSKHPSLQQYIGVQNSHTVTTQQLSFVLIGQASALIPCAEKLLQEGHVVHQIVSPDQLANDWSQAHNINHLSSIKHLASAMGTTPFDYLFSIFNEEILPLALLTLPIRGAINFHDALLPRYGGLYAPSWAIFNQESMHGVTWHLMAEGVDQGDILKQYQIPITADETAFMLNAKSYEIAIESFPQLIEDLQQNLIQPQPQNLAQRSYFLSTARPTPGCVVNFGWSATVIAAFFRALDFGTYENPFGLPKLHVAGNFYLIDGLEITQQSSAEVPCTIVALSRDSMRISTASEDVIVRSLQTLEGTPVDLRNWATQHRLQVGALLKSCSSEQEKAIETIEINCLRTENFWVERLSVIELLSLPLPNTHREPNSDQRKTVLWEPNASLQAFLEKASNENRQQPILSAVFAAFLARIGQRDAFDLGLFATNEQSNNRSLNNLFSSIVPCHINVDAKQNLSKTIAEVSTQIERTQRHKTFHRDIVSRYPDLSSLKQVPLEQHFTTVISLPKELNSTGYIPASAFEISIDTAGKCACIYDENQYRTVDIERLLHSFSAFSEQWVRHAAKPLSAISLLSSADATDLERWKQPATAFPRKQVHELFEAQVEQTPDAIALIDGSTQETLTYQQLNSRANQLGHYLRSQNIKPETLVGLCVERSTNMIVGILGILKAGGAYLPLDPTYSAERLNTIVADAKPALMLTSAQSLETAPSGTLSKICIDTQWDEVACWPDSNLKSLGDDNTLAYVIYTSGSTGKPKGVMVEQAALTNFALAACHTYGLTEPASPTSPQHRVLQFASISFDTAAEEIYPCLLSGGSLILRTEAAAGGLIALRTVCQQWQLTVLDLPTAYWQQLVTEAAQSEQNYPIFPEHLRLIIIGGEKVAVESVEQWQRLMSAQINRPKLLNTYGPTETTVVATAYEIPNQPEANRFGQEIAIGKPFANVDTYVLDAHKQRVPVGVPGELYIGGPGVARGYLNRLDQTANAFVTSPFDRSGLTRLYRTGDHVRYLPDGNLEYLGRFDHQIKMRGFRIELGEIETALAQQEGVQQSLVMMREDRPGHPQLAAYAIISDSATVTANDLRQSLKGRLPDYMVPSVFVLLESFPLTKNGKIDRRALPVPDQADIRQGQIYTAPRTDTEAKLVKIVADVLGIEKVGIKDNFFEIGGHSLLATQVVVRIQDYFHIKIALRSIFEQPTIASLASLIAKQNTDETLTDIPNISRNHPLPLSFAQQRLWFVDQFEVEDSEVYNIPLALQLSGPLNVIALEQAISAVICRHEALRANFKLIEGTPLQVIRPAEPASLPVADLQSLLRNKTTLEREALISQQFRRVLQTPFDLSCEPLLRVELLKLDANLHILLINMHHIVSDGWSIGVFKRELSTLYRDFSQQQAPSLPPLPVQYADFAHWQRQQNTFAPQLDYWLNQLQGIPQQLELPTDYPRPLVQTFRGGAVNFQLSAKLAKKLKDLAQSSGATLFITLLAAFSALLHRYSNAEDIVIGSPIANRNRSEIEPLIGLFANSLLLRVDLANKPTFNDLLSQLKQTAIEAYHHRELPFEKIVEAINPERNLGYNPLFQVMFALQNADSEPLSLSNITVSPVTVERTTSKVDLMLSMRETPEGMTGSWQYNSDLFAEETIHRMTGHLTTILTGIVANPSEPVSKLPLLTATEQHQILTDWNSTPSHSSSDQCIHQLFEAQAVRSPDAIAVIFEGEQLTYRELNEQTNQLAHYLQKLGVKPEIKVGLYLTRSLKTIVSILAVLKAGGCYVPLDANNPEARLEFIVADAEVNILLSETQLLSKLSNQTTSHAVLRVNLDADWPIIIQSSTKNLVCTVTPQNLIYIIYTSGTTGRPKGVSIQHSNVTNFIHAIEQQFQFNEQDVWALLHSYAFDVSVLDIWGALLFGGRLVVVPETTIRAPDLLLHLLHTEQVSVLSQTPSAFTQMIQIEETMPEPLPFRHIILGGEALNAHSALSWLEQHKDYPLRLSNMYGPTETTIYVTHRFVSLADATDVANTKGSLLGRPIPGVQLYILDSQQQLLPVGIPGELCVSGNSLARGYYNRPELTGEKFVTNPFYLPSDEADADATTIGERLYRTGDLGCYLPNGDICYLGRIDNQVKVRGFRIELGEIESVLIQQPEVSAAAVVVDDRDHDNQQLVAHIVPKEGSATPTAQGLRAALKQKLPDYMVPTTYLTSAALPLTTSGKVDRKALSAIANNIAAATKMPAPAEVQFAPPTTSIEKQLSDIWCDLLQLERVGIHDNFFDIGGHSLLAMRVIVRLRKVFNTQLAVRSLFEYSTIATLASLIEQQNTAAVLTEIPKISRSHPLPLSFAQQRLWFIDQFETDSRSVYNIPTALQLSGQLDIVALEQALSELSDRHEALRSNFKSIEGIPTQTIRPAEPISIPVVDLQSSVENGISLDQKSQIAQQCRRVLQTPFDLSCEPLLRVELLKLQPDLHILLVNMHHIVSDGWSLGVFNQELSTLYRDFSQQKSPSLAPLPIQYADFAHWQRQQDALAPHLDYWLGQLKDIPQQIALPTDYPRPLVQTFRGSTVSFQLGAELSAQLTSLALSSKTTLFITLLAAFSALLHRYSSAEDIVIGSPVANRSRSEIEPLVGLFVNTLLLRANLADEPTFSDLLAQLKQTALEAYNHQELPFEKIVEAINPDRNLSYNPLFQIMFVLQNAATNPLNLPGITVTPIAVERTTAKVDLTLSMRETSEGLIGTWEYNSDLFAAKTIQRMAKHFEILLAGITTDPLQSIAKLPLLTAVEQQQILADWNPAGSDYPSDQCIHQLFEQQVRRSPNAIVIAHGNEQLTYQALNNRANKLARQLRPKLENIRSTAFVGIFIENTLQRTVSMLAVLKAGGAYVPIDTDYPEERLSFIIKDAQLAVLIAQATLKPKIEKITSAEVEIICCDSSWENAATDDDSVNLPKRSLITSDSTAYLIYTSGSTGKPKGVQTPHRAVSRLVLNTNYIQITPENRIAQISSTSFDAATFEIWGALLNGAQLISLPKEVVLNPEDFVHHLRTANIDTLFLTTALFNQTALLIPDAFSSLKTVLFGGEAAARAPVEQVLRLGKPQRLVNVYGPTENTTFSTFYEITDVPKQATSLPIGCPIANSTAYVLDDCNQPVPIGIPGELCVGGEGLARGYLMRPELTAHKFVEVSLFDTPSVRLYKTGDLVKRLPSGKIEFIGRKDFQVKIRGFRVELGEVESALLQILEVEAAVAIAQADASGNQAIIAYLSPRSSMTIDAAQVKSKLQQRLPSFMIPASIRIVPKLPLTLNGKVNRQLLSQTEQSAVSTPTVENAPRNEIEQQLVQIWESCLGVKPIGIHDNFFDLGGHSLIATKVLFLINQKLDLTFSINQFFKTPTIAGLLRELTAQDTVSLPPCLVQMKSSEEKSDSPTPPLFLIHAGGPSILFYRPLVEALTIDRPIYGIQSALLDDLATHSDSVLNSVEALATFYITQIKAVQPDGPYSIGGASFGGIVAYEMAQQLVSQGDRIASLILLDRPAPGGRSLLPLTQRYRSYWTKVLKNGPTYLLDKIQRRTVFEMHRFQQRYKTIKETIKQPATAASNDLYKRHIQLSEVYEPKPYTGKVFVVRAESMPEGFIVHEEDLGWSRYAKGGVRVLSNPGGHMTMFQTPYVETLAAQIDTLLGAV